MISGIRETAELAVRAGFRYIQFYEPDEEMSECVDAYLKALKPVPSPYLVDGQLSEKAEKGRKVFEKLKCGECHSGPYFTDMKMHVIGENVEFGTRLGHTNSSGSLAHSPLFVQWCRRYHGRGFHHLQAWYREKSIV